MPMAGGVTLHALTRNGFVLAGLLLLGVGLGDAIAGRMKLAQYQEIVRTTAPAEPREHSGLFPTASEGQERHAIARAKLGFYQLLFSAGQLLAAVGFVLLVIGVVQLRFRTLRSAALPP